MLIIQYFSYNKKNSPERTLFIKRLSVIQYMLLLIFFVYPGPKGSEEPSQAPPCTGSSLTPAPGGAKNRCDVYRRARRSQNQFTPLGEGVNKLIFKRFNILCVWLPRCIFLLNLT